MDSPAQDLTTRPISEHNGDLVCILVKVMQFDNVLVHLGALVVAGDGAQVSVRLVFSHISCACMLDPYNPTAIDYLQSDGTGHLLGVYTVRVTCVCELTSQHV